MMHQDPSQRPDASSALAEFERIASGLGSRALNSRVLLYKKSLYARTCRKMRKRLAYTVCLTLSLSSVKILMAVQSQEGDEEAIRCLLRILSRIFVRRKNTESEKGGTYTTSATVCGASGSKSVLPFHEKTIQGS
jgi:hypothetical protein